MRLGIRDRRVLAAFLDRKPADGHKLSTDGERLDGHWLGGRGIVNWTDAHSAIVENDLGSKVAQTVQNTLRRMVKDLPAKLRPVYWKMPSPRRIATRMHGRY